MVFFADKSRLFLIVSLLFLMSCSSDVKPPEYDVQRSFFLNTIEQVQQGGALLQQRTLSDTDIKAAMALLDSAMMDANAVEASFLKWMDSGLYQAFAGYLLKGIENYRLGVELEDKEQQAKGIAQLQRWWQFWQLKRPAILKKLDAPI